LQVRKKKEEMCEEKVEALGILRDVVIFLSSLSLHFATLFLLFYH
jgi:hypothetical protein